MASSEAQPPKAIIHQRILRVAESKPDASLDTIADEVSGASIDLVERVLDEYGDPAESPEKTTPSQTEVGQAETVSTIDETVTSPDSYEYPDWGSLTDKERETLVEVFDSPQATQQEIAERLGVSAATVSNRLSNIEGFDWSERQAIIKDFADSELRTNGKGEHKTNMTELDHREETSEPSTVSASSEEPPSRNPEFVHKVIRVCMNSEEFTKDEELDLIKYLI